MTFPHLFSFVRNKDISIIQAVDINRGNMHDLFHVPLSAIAANQCNGRDIQTVRALDPAYVHAVTNQTTLSL
jgi:hypothetical protein